jgi:hypothetical protein
MSRWNSPVAALDRGLLFAASMKTTLMAALLVLSTPALAADHTTVTVDRNPATRTATFKFRGPTAKDAARVLHSYATANGLDSHKSVHVPFAGFTVKVKELPDATLTLGQLHKEAPSIADETDQASIYRNSS